MNDEFIADLTNSKFYRMLFDGKDVVMIYIAGSRIYNVLDDRSDYDIVVITNKDDQDYPNEYLT